MLVALPTISLVLVCSCDCALLACVINVAQSTLEVNSNPLHPIHLTTAMNRSRRQPRSRRDDGEKRGDGGEFDDMEAFVHKKKRQLGDLKEESERLRSERNRLRAELARKSSAVELLEQQLKDARARAIKRCKTILDEAFAEIFYAPAEDVSTGAVAKADTEDGEESEQSEEPAGDAGVPIAQDTSTAQPVPLPLAGPGDAAPAPDKQDAPQSEVAYTGFAVHQTLLSGQ